MQDYQNILFPYAYNILGSAEDARDAIQDVLLKYTSKGVAPENEKNYLIKGVVNQSINAKRQKKRFQTDEGWLPEPVSTEGSDLGVEMREMVSYSVLFLLERLGPKERAVFILKEAFAYTHQEIAEVLSITVENSRKLLSRAHQKVQQKTKQIKHPSNKHFDYLDRFTNAIIDRRLGDLHKLLTADVEFYADGGEKVRVVKKYCMGLEEVADLLIYTFHKYQAKYRIVPSVVNHQPALLYYYRDKLRVCQVFEIQEDPLKIKGISVVLDPVKLNTLQLLNK
ncbi:MAG: sigma-70 family RNA polymerase sigma factor [Cyclobacteriaceae bacterium]